MKVIRKTLIGNCEAFNFDVCGLRFLVKNFSDEDVFVNIEEITNDNLTSSIKIPVQTAQVVVMNEYDVPHSKYARETLYLKGTGEVEVQVLLW